MSVRVMKQAEYAEERERELPNSSCVPTTQRPCRATSDKLPLLTSGTQEGTVTDSDS